MTRRVLVDVAPLRIHAGFRKMWIGQLLAQFGRQASALAIPYQIYVETSSPLAIGGFGLVTVAALGLLALPSGALADAIDRRILIVVAQGGQIIVSVGLAILAFQADQPLLLLYLLAFASASLAVLDRPARRAAIPRLVDTQRLASANVLDSALVQVARLGGPAVAGILISSAGLPSVYLLEAALFGLALLLAISLPAIPPTGAPAGIGLQALTDSLRFMRRSPVVLAAFGVDLCAMVFGSPTALFPIIAEDVMHGGPELLALLAVAPAAGAMAGTLISGWMGSVVQQGRAVIAAVLCWGAAVIGFGFALSAIPLALGFLILAGTADVVSTVFRASILQIAAPDEMRGRVSGLHVLIVQGGPRLGDIEAATVAAVAGPQFSVISGGVLCLLGTILIAVRVPELAAFRAPRRSDVARSNATTPRGAGA
jgi:MFS family permease